jgi:hypothetical protein
MTTDSTKAIWALIRTRLLTYVPPTGSTLTTTLGGRLYLTAAPDDAVFPYAVATLTRLQTPGYSGFRETWQVELQCYGSPRSTQWTIEGVADVADQAMLTWEDRTDGVAFGGYRSRWTLPPFPDPADRELVRVRCLYEVGVWPDLFTQHVP